MALLCPSNEIAAIVGDKIVSFVDVESGATQATVTFSSSVEHVAWSPSGVYAIIADKMGGLNFVLKDGKLIFRQPLLQTPAEGSVTHAFGSVQFVTPCDDTEFDEIIVLAADGKLFHFSNISSKVFSEFATAARPASLLLAVKKNMITRIGTSKINIASTSCWVSAARSIEKTRFLILSQVDNCFSIETWEVDMGGNKDEGPGSLRMASVSSLSVPSFVSSEDTILVKLITSFQTDQFYDTVLVSSFEGKSFEWWQSAGSENGNWRLLKKWMCPNQERCLDFYVADQGVIICPSTRIESSKVVVLVADADDKPKAVFLQSEGINEQSVKAMPCAFREKFVDSISGFESLLDLKFVSSASASAKVFVSSVNSDQAYFCPIDLAVFSNSSNDYEGPFKPVSLSDGCENEHVVALHDAVVGFFGSLKDNENASEAAVLLAENIRNSLSQLISLPDQFIQGIRLLHDLVPIGASIRVGSLMNSPPNSCILNTSTLQLFLASSPTSKDSPLVSVIFNAVKKVVVAAKDQLSDDGNENKSNVTMYNELLAIIIRQERLLATASKILLDESARAKDVTQTQAGDMCQSSGACHLGVDVAWSLVTGEDPLMIAAQCLKLRLISAASRIWRNHGVSYLLDSAKQQSIVDGDSGCSKLLISAGSVVVDMLNSAPCDINPTSFSLWIESEVIPVLTPNAVATLRRWTVVRCRLLCASHPSGHPTWAIELATSIDQATQKYLGVRASADATFVRWQRYGCSSCADVKLEGTPRRSLMAHFDEMAGASNSPMLSIASQKSPEMIRSSTGQSEMQDGALWSEDELSVLLCRLTELSLLWDVHGLEMSLKEYEKIDPRDVAFKLLDRAHKATNATEESSILLMDHIKQHVIPFSQSRGLDVVTLLLDYTVKVSELMADTPPTHVARANLKLLCRQRRIAQASEQMAARKQSKALSTSSLMNRAGECSKGLKKKVSGSIHYHEDEDIVEAEAAAFSDEHIRLSENGVAVLKCIAVLMKSRDLSAPEKSSIETCSKLSTATLSLLQTAVPPLSPGIKSLASDISHDKLTEWGLEFFARGVSGDEVGDKLREAARHLRILEIVAHYKVSNFDPMDTLHATRLVNFLCTFHAPQRRIGSNNDASDAELEEEAVAAGALDDALHICSSYTHLSHVTVVSRYLLNLIQIRAASEDEFDFALSKLKNREDALAVSDVVLRYCKDGIQRLSLLAKSNDTSMMKKIDEEYDRYTLTGLRIAAIWANVEAAQRTKEEQLTLQFENITTVQSTSTSGKGNIQSSSSINQCFMISGHRRLDPVSNVRISTKRSSSIDGPAGLVSDFNKVRALHREFGLMFSMSSLHDKSLVSVTMSDIVKKHVSSIDYQRKGSSVELDEKQTAPNPVKKAKSSCKKTLKKRGGNSEVLQTIDGESSNDQLDGKLGKGDGMEVLRRAAYLLSVPWCLVAAEVAKSVLKDSSTAFEASRSVDGNGVSFNDSVKSALGICQEIWSSGTVAFQAGHGVLTSASSNQHTSGCHINDSELASADAALALRDIASTFSKTMLSPSSMSQDSPLIPLAAAEVLCLLQRSLTICSREDLSRALDILRSAEIIASVLARTQGGEKFELRAINYELESSKMKLSGSTEVSVKVVENYFKSMEPLHDWDRGDGLLLPPAEAQRLASSVAFSELNDRVSLASIGDLPNREIKSTNNGPPVSSMKGKLLATPSGYNAMTPGQTPTSKPKVGEGATADLIEMLMKHGAAKLAFKIVAGAVATSHDSDAMDRLVPILTAISEASLVLAIPDFSLAFGAISALPQRSGFGTLMRMTDNVISGDRDYRRLEVLGTLAIAVSLVWKQPNYVSVFKKRKQQAQWWRKLEILEIPFQHKTLVSNIQASPNDNTSNEESARHAAQLIPALLEQLANDKISLFEVRDFAAEFGVESYIPDLLYAEHVLKNRSKMISNVGLNDTKPHQQLKSSLTTSDSKFMKVDADLLDQALFDDKSQMEDSTLKSKRLDLVIQLLQGMLPSLLEIDYEGIEYIHGALLKALDLKLDAKKKSEEKGEVESLDNVIQEYEKRNEILVMLQGLKLALPSKRDDQLPHEYRIPFFSLLEKPRDILTTVVNVSNLHKVNVLARLLQLRNGECYALLLRSRFSVSGSFHQITPSIAETLKWLKEITDVSLGVETAEWLAAQVSGSYKQSILNGAIHLAQLWKSEAVRANHEQDQQLADDSLKRLSMSLLTSTCESAICEVNPMLLDEVVSTKPDSGRNSETLRLKDLLGDPKSLVTELYSIASLVAAKAVLDSSHAHVTISDVKSDVPSLANSPSCRASCIDLVKCVTVSGIHLFASKLLGTVEKIAEVASSCSELSQISGSLSTTMIRQKLVRDWLERPLSATISMSNSKSSSLQKRGNQTLVSANSSVVDDSKSVFRIPKRELAELEDLELSLRVAVLLAPLSDLKESSIRSDALRVLLDVAIGRSASAKHSSRTHLRALRAFSIIASPTEMNTLVSAAVSKGSLNGGALKMNIESFSYEKRSEKGRELCCIAEQGSRLAQVAWLEELRLPTQGLLDGLGESLVRALWRDHNREEMLPPVLIDILLCSANSQLTSSNPSSAALIFSDGDLWVSLLQASVEGGHWRETLSLLPSMGVAITAARDSSHQKHIKWTASNEKALAEIWDLILRRPLIELEQRSNGEIIGQSGSLDDSKSQTPLPSLSSSIIFGSSVAPVKSTAEVLPTSGMEELCGLTEASVLPVLELIVDGLRTCPFLDELDLNFFACGIASSSQHYSSTDKRVEFHSSSHHHIQRLAIKVASFAMGLSRKRIEDRIKGIKF